MSKEILNKLLLGTSMLACIAFASQTHAQEATEEEEAEVAIDEDEVVEDEVVEEEDGAEGDDIVVTGSRVKKSSFNSISPVQVITTEQSRDVGEFDATTILQRSEAASGQQIDATFQGFVLDNGPGSSTLNLRGLGASRSLVLINGRRVAPAGVEGAPTNPSINLLPSSLIARFDILTDGASSLYGSDAIAGVVNAIYRKDFDGLELFANGDLNQQGAGHDFTVSAAYGLNLDRGFFGIGLEYARQDEVRLRDRDFLSGCETNREITDTGEIRTIGLRDGAIVRDRTPGVTVSDNECRIGSLSGRVFIPFTNLGSVYFQPGAGNTGIPNFSESTIFGVDIDADGDGIRDVDFQDFNNNGTNLDQTFFTGSETYNAAAYGEYTFDGAANVTAYFEANYSRSESGSPNTGTPQIFPFVSATSIFNPCAIATGVDCRNAQNVAFGSNIQTGFDLPVNPIVSIRGDRNNTDQTIEQYRGVFGFKGDLPFIGPSWSFDASGVYSYSVGNSVRRGIREDKLAFALGIDPTADFDGDGVVDNNNDGIADDYDPSLEIGGVFGGPEIDACDASALANPGLALADLTQGCVEVNLFAESVLGQTVGDFATQAERDFVFGVRTFRTIYEQYTLSAFATGDLFALPGGAAKIAFGAEYRKDRIDSTPNVVASNGLFFGFASDRGAVGSKVIKEAFAELDLPLVLGKPWVEELTINVSGRGTDEEFYGVEGTYSIKGEWRPIAPLAFRLSYGTSYRAPNLRENFLAGQSGFSTLFDPCAVPDAAFVTGVYNAALDQRDPSILANCIREGRNPTTVGIDSAGLNVLQTNGVEVTAGGSLDLEEETSTALTAGFAFQKDVAGVSVALSGNYYDIQVRNAVSEPSAQFIVNDCFARLDTSSRSQFCDRISVDTIPTSRMLVSDVASGFINLNGEAVRGLDFNSNFFKSVSLFGKNVGLSLNVNASHLIERSNFFIGDDGNVAFDEDVGEFGFPSWTGRATFSANVDNLTFTWQTRFINSVSQPAGAIDPLGDAFLNTGFIGDTCLGAGSPPTMAGIQNVPGDGVTCRDVGFANDYYVHTISLAYRRPGLTLRAGITNLFDRDPPLVDPTEVLSISNIPIGNGFDLNGREFFMSIVKQF